MKLLSKLLLLVCGLLLLTIGSLGVAYYWIQQREIRVEMNHAQKQTLENLCLIAKDAMITRNDLLLVKYVTLMTKGNPIVLRASIVDNSSHILADSQIDQIGQTLHAITDLQQDQDMTFGIKEDLVFYEPIKIGTTPLGTVYLFISRVGLRTELANRLQGLPKS